MQAIIFLSLITHLPKGRIVVRKDKIKKMKTWLYLGGMVNMYWDMNAEDKIRVEGIYDNKKCTQGKQDKTLRADLFNSTVLTAMSNVRETWVTTE